MFRTSLLLLASCFTRIPFEVAATDPGDDTGVPDSGAASDDTAPDTAPEPVAVTAISPDRGSTAGGVAVTITGGPFHGPAAVWFGEAEASVADQDEDWLLVDLPAAAAGTGVVDVTVRSQDTSVAVPSGFHYWDDASGQAQILASWTYLRPAWPGDWSAAGALQVSGWAALLEPADSWPRDRHGAGLDTCSQLPWAITGVQGPATVDLVTRQHTLSLAWDAASTTYGASAEVAESYAEATEVDLVLAESAVTPDLDLSNVIVTPPTFTVTAPNLHTDEPIEAYANPLALSWSGTASDYVVIQVLDLNNGATVTCLVEDDGSFEIDLGQLEVLDWRWDVSWNPHGADVLLTLISFNDDATSLDYNNAQLRAEGGFGVYQAVWLYRDLF